MCFLGKCCSAKSEKFEIVYQVNNRMTRSAVSCETCFRKCIFPSPSTTTEKVQKIKINLRSSSWSYLAVFIVRLAAFFTRLFIDIIMGNFRQHGKIYFTSCSRELIEFRMEEEKFTGQNCFSIDIGASCLLLLLREFAGIFKYPPELPRFRLSHCHHQFGCIKEAKKIENSIADSFLSLLAETEIRRMFLYAAWVSGAGGKELKMCNKNLKTLEEFNFFALLAQTKMDFQKAPQKKRRFKACSRAANAIKIF